jgi:hypothetical protein
MQIIGLLGLLLLIVFVPPMLEPIGCWEYRFREHVKRIKIFIVAAVLVGLFYLSLTAIAS